MKVREIFPDENTYWEELKMKAPRRYGFNLQIVNYFRNKPGINIGLREKSIVVSISLKKNNDSFTIFWLWIKGSLQIAPKTIARHLSQSAYSGNIAEEFRLKMRKLFGTSPKQEEITGALSGRTIATFKESVDEFIQRIRAEES